MGVLRLILAISVVFDHIPLLTYRVATGGDVSVQCFYVISGFFMSLILNEKYATSSQNTLFYSNRLIRIFSVYWIFFVLALAVDAVGYFAKHKGVIALFVDNAWRMRPLDIVFLVVSNIAIIGQDLALFLGLTDGGLVWSERFRDFDPGTYRFYLLPQAWSLSLELLFYGLAPFLVRRSFGFVLGVFLTSMMVRVVLHARGLDFDPWSYRFFPAELSLFLAGTLSYHLFKRVRGKTLTHFQIALGWSTVLAVLAYPLYGGPEGQFLQPARVALLTLVAVGLPFLFLHTGTIAFDRLAGELSYPVYLCHLIFVQIVHTGPIARALIVVACSIGCAYATHRWAEVPLDRIRQRRYQRVVAAREGY